MTVPLNSVTWTLGSISMYTLAYRSWRSFVANRNPIAEIYMWIGLTLGTGFLFIGLPGLLTTDNNILKYCYFASDVMIQLTMQVLAWLVWFLGLRQWLSLKTILAFTLTFSAILLLVEVQTSTVSLSQSPHLMVTSDQTSVLIMKSIIYTVIPIPLGYFFIKRVPNQPSLRGKLRSLVTGLIFIVLSLVTVINNIVYKGSDTVDSTKLLATFFIVFCIVNLLPRAKIRTY